MQPDEILKTLFRDVPDFPKPGIMFRDITPLLAHPRERNLVVEAIATKYENVHVDAIAAIEARGFLFGMLLAQKFNVPFVPVRKEGKLPFTKIRKEYALEYGSAVVEMHEDAIISGWKVLVHDDLLATGGTACAAGELIEELGGTVAGFSFIAGLSALPGAQMLKSRFNISPYCLINY